MFAETAELAVRISLKDNVSAGVRGLQGKLAGLNGSLGRVGKGVGQIGTGLARAGLLVGGAAITGIAAAAKAAIDFEDAFAGVRKTVSEADLAAAGLTFDDLARSFRNMATEIPISAVELAKIGETAGALGIRAQDIDDFTKTVALLSVTTDLTADQAAESLGKVGTILGLTGQEFDDFADVLVNLGNQGASVESEIIEVTKRFAAMGRQAGLTVPQILALSSAATSLGAEPEAAGSALSRIFANMTTEIANSTSKGKAFAKITGQSLDQLKKRVDKGGALGIMLSTLQGISKMSRTEAASTLKALGITNVRDRNAILLMSQNLGFVNEQLEIAKNSEGALWREAEKRFATTASKITLVKQNLIETGIALGTELLPAVRRVLDKIIGVLKDPATKTWAVNLGRDIGKAIDKIDWKAVLDGAKTFVGMMKGALDFVLLLASAVDKLPDQIKAAGAGFLVLNKLSGGLIGAGAGNIVGGLFQQFLGRGSSPANPVWVAGLGLGGGGVPGVPGRKGGLGGIGGAVAVGIGAAVITEALAITWKDIILPGLQTQADQNVQATQHLLQTGTLADLQAALAGLENMPNELDPLQRVLYELNAGGVKTHTETLEAAIRDQIKALKESGSTGGDRRLDTIEGQRGGVDWAAFGNRAERRADRRADRLAARMREQAEAARTANRNIESLRGRQETANALLGQIARKPTAFKVFVPVTVNARITASDVNTTVSAQDAYWSSITGMGGH